VDRLQSEHRRESPSELDGRIKMRTTFFLLVYLTAVVVLSFLLGRWLGKTQYTQILTTII